MRTTLTLDDDVLSQARAIAEERGQSLGEVISTLARAALTQPAVDAKTRNGVPLLPRRPGLANVDMTIVNRLRDDPA